MGYYTHYSLEINRSDFSEELEDVLTLNDYCDYSPLMGFFNGDADSCKWYNHEEDMLKLSKDFPDILFTLKGEGEEAGDLWVKYFKGGKKQVANAQISYELFDEKKLT